MRHGSCWRCCSTPCRAGRAPQVHFALDPLDQPRRLRRICNSRLRTHRSSTSKHCRSCRRSQVHWGLSDRPNVSSDSHCRSSTRSDQVRRSSLCRRLLGISDNLGIGILLENFSPRKWLRVASKSNCLKWAPSVEKRHETPISEVEASERAVKSKISKSFTPSQKELPARAAPQRDPLALAKACAWFPR